MFQRKIYSLPEETLCRFGSGGCACSGDLVLEGNSCVLPCSGTGKIVDQNGDCVCDADNLFVSDGSGGCECEELSILENDECVPVPGVYFTDYNGEHPVVFCYGSNLETCVNMTTVFYTDYGVAFDPTTNRLFVGDYDGVHVCDRFGADCTMTSINDNKVYGLAVSGSTLVVTYDGNPEYPAAVCSVQLDNSLDCDLANAYNADSQTEAAISPDGSVVYLSHYADSLVRRCEVSGTQLTNCVETTLASGTAYEWKKPWGMTYANNKLYVADYNNYTVGICDDNGSGVLDCGFTSGFDRLYVSDVSVDGTTVYVVNYAEGDIIWKCTENDKLLENCQELPVFSFEYIAYIAGTWGA